MHRRQLIASFSSLASLGLVPTAALAADGDIVKGRKGGPDMIRGNPPKLDFGGGLVIPMDNGIFRTLWEGPDRWVTYGRGLSPRRATAMALAQRTAEATMKFSLLTLAFAPDRMVRAETSGWRLASGNIKDYVVGDIALPGRPVMPTTDEVSGGDSPDGEPQTRALSGYMVLKKDAPLDYVRKFGRQLEPAAAG